MPNLHVSGCLIGFCCRIALLRYFIISLAQLCHTVIFHNFHIDTFFTLLVSYFSFHNIVTLKFVSYLVCVYMYINIYI